MMQAYSDKVGVEMSAFKFHLDGIRIKPNQTPNEHCNLILKTEMRSTHLFTK
ncbi:unnamed protein product [Arabidopsis halleri]